MDAPVRSGKWSNFCHQLEHVSDQEFSQKIPTAMEKLNAKVASLFVEWNQNSNCKEDLNHLLDRATRLNNPRISDQKIKLLRTLLALKDGTSNLETETFRKRIENYEVKRGADFLKEPAVKLLTSILQDLAAAGPLLKHDKACRTKLLAIMDALYESIHALPDQRRYGPILRVFARRMEQLVPGSVSEKCKAYDERTVKLHIGEKVIGVTQQALRDVARDCTFFAGKDLTAVEIHLPEYLHVAAFKDLVRWYETEREGGKISYQRDFTRDDSIAVAIALGNTNRLKVLITSYSGIYGAMNMLHDNEVIAAQGFKKFQELMNLAERYPHSVIEEALKKDKEFLIGNIPNYPRSPNFWKLARHELPSDISHAMITRIDELIQNPESSALSLGADPVIPMVKAWLKLVRQEKMPHNNEALSWAIEEALLKFSHEPATQMMDKFRTAFPEFIVQHNKQVDFVVEKDEQGDIDEFGEITKKHNEAPSLKVDLSAAKKNIPFEILEKFVGWNFSELKFHEKTPEVEKLMLVMPMTKFEFVVPPPPPSAAGEFFKRIITGF